MSRMTLWTIAAAVVMALAVPGAPMAADTPKAASPAAAAQDSRVLDLNLATAPELEALNGIGPSLAQRIVEYRQQHGPFKTVDDLLAIVGIGPKSLEAFRDQVKVVPPKTAAQAR